ncbi:ATP-dependent helicase/nuclease subunit A [Geobacillus sp. BCO2]|nr:ATP-dependent helicase/nuclease subunit A [Geobacillus sp. BCO2]
MDGGVLLALEQGRPVPVEGGWQKEVKRRLLWRYSYEKETAVRAKQSVSELKEHRALFGEQADEWRPRQGTAPVFSRPRFMQEKTLTPAEKGRRSISSCAILICRRRLMNRRSAVRSSALSKKSCCRQNKPRRSIQRPSLPFSLQILAAAFAPPAKCTVKCRSGLGLKAAELYGGEGAESGRRVLVQGVIDCVFADECGYVMIDYKTDEVVHRFAGQEEEAARFLLGRYGTQMRLYRRAIEQIWRAPVAECYLYSFDGGFVVAVE